MQHHTKEHSPPDLREGPDEISAEAIDPVLTFVLYRACYCALIGGLFRLAPASLANRSFQKGSQNFFRLHALQD